MDQLPLSIPQSNPVVTDQQFIEQQADKRRMTLAVFGQDVDGNLIELGKPTYIYVPRGCEVIIRCRRAGMMPQEWRSENWERDCALQDSTKVGLWADD